MDFYDLVKKRSSIRSFDKERAVPDDVLYRILNAGRMAPSAKNLQPWRFHVVRSPEMLKKIYPCYSRDWIQSAPCFLIVTGKRNNAWVRNQDGYNSLETDLAIVMDHLVLAATWEGMGTCWIAAFDPAILHDALQLSPTEELFAFTPLGYASPEEIKAPKARKSLDEITEFL
jgi:nitroreductase